MHNIHIIIISAIIFLIINIIENIIHYNIGKYHDMETSLSFPSKIDLLKIYPACCVCGVRAKIWPKTNPDFEIVSNSDSLR